MAGRKQRPRSHQDQCRDTLRMSDKMALEGRSPMISVTVEAPSTSHNPGK